MNWSPDSKYASISFGEEEDNVGWPRAYAVDAQAKQVFDSGETMLYDIIWSPDNTYYAFNDDLFSLTLGRGDLKKRDSVFQYRPQTWVSLLGWSPDSQYLLFRERRNFAILNAQDMSIERVLALPGLQLSLELKPLVWWSPSSDSLYFVAADETGTHGIYLYDMETRKPELLAELSKPPNESRSLDASAMLSPDNKYSLLYFVNVEDKTTYVIIENQTHTVKAQIEASSSAPRFQLLK